MTAPSDRERIALAVHEVRSPAAALAAIVTAIRVGELDEESLRVLVELSLAACHSIDRIIGDAAPGELRLEELDVVEVARDAVAGAALAGTQIDMSFDPGLPLIVGDRVRLRQALDNLIQNARAAGGPRGDVVVRLRATRGTLFVSVSDSGDGISADDLSRIFEPGVRLDARGVGSGLGLAVVRSVAEAHGGTAAVESSPGEGATFTIALPLAGSQPAATTSSS